MRVLPAELRVQEGLKQAHAEPRGRRNVQLWGVFGNVLAAEVAEGTRRHAPRDSAAGERRGRRLPADFQRTSHVRHVLFGAVAGGGRWHVTRVTAAGGFV